MQLDIHIIQLLHIVNLPAQWPTVTTAIFQHPVLNALVATQSVQAQLHVSLFVQSPTVKAALSHKHVLNAT